MLEVFLMYCLKKWYSYPEKQKNFSDLPTLFQNEAERQWFLTQQLAAKYLKSHGWLEHIQLCFSFD